MSRLGVQTSHSQHTKHRTQCPDPDSCYWHTNPIGEARISPLLPARLPWNTQKHKPLPPQPQLVSQSPHDPTTSPQSCNLPTHMLAPMQICSHMGCFTHTNVKAQAEPHMGSDFFPRSVFSSGEPALQLSRVLCWFLTSYYPRWPPQLHPSATGSAGAYPPSISITSIFLEHNSCYTSSPLASFFLSTCSNQSTLTAFPFVRRLPPSLAGTAKLR